MLLEYWIDFKILFFLLLVHQIHGATKVKPEDVVPECIVDSTKPYTEKENYVECTSKEMVAEGKTDCCKVDTEVGCCKKGERWNEVQSISIGIGVGTVTLILIIFFWYWCNEETFPCLKTCKANCRRNYLKWEEKQPCCQKRVRERRTKAEKVRKAAMIPDLEVPEELKCNVQDDFWGVPQGEFNEGYY